VIHIRNVNTDSLIEAVVETPDGYVEYDGDTVIDGVPGKAAPILLNFMEVIGSKTGALFPTGKRKEVIEGVEVSCVDVAMPMVLTTAESMGVRGDESKAELDANRELLEKLEAVRVVAGEKMGLGDVRGKVIPKFGILSRPRRGGALTSRYFVPTDCHPAHAVTGAICVGSCALVPGTVADGIAETGGGFSELVEVEHPSGSITVAFELSGVGDDFALEKAGVVRTTRKLFQGQIYVPGRVWSPRM
jgi:2-methylaconitate cis-trans-isomerase PrpF